MPRWVQHPSRWGLALCVALLARMVRAAEPSDLPPPLPWREPAPLARLFLQPPFEAPAVLDPGRTEVRFQLLYSNALLLESSASLSLDVHVETAQPTVTWRRGLSPGLEVQISLSAVGDYGGFLDGPIDWVEGAFGASKLRQHPMQRNAAHFLLLRDTGEGLRYDGAEAGLGDSWIGLKAALPTRVAGAEMAVRAFAKLPTGRLPFGSEEFDWGLGVLVAWNGRTHALRLACDLMVPTADLPVIHLSTHPYGAAHIGYTRRLGPRASLQIQGSAHLAPLSGTGLDALDRSTAYVLAGLSVTTSETTRLGAGIIENVFSPGRGADISFYLGLDARW